MDFPVPSDPPVPKGLEAIARRLVVLAEQDTVSIGDMLEGFGRASFVPLLVVPAFIIFTPLSGIPLLPTALGLVIGLVSLQMAFRRRHLWLPGVLKRRRISGKRLGRAMARIRPMVRWVDRRTRDRLSIFVMQPVATLARIACALCGFTMPFLEVVPFSSSILAVAVLLFATGFLAQDGLLVLLAFSVMGLAMLIPLWVFF